MRSLNFYTMLAGLMSTIPSATERNPVARITGRKFSGIPKGCREYNIDGKVVIALNEKNAIRKAKKLKINA